MNIYTKNVTISPFRSITVYPTDKDIVNGLVGSINETGWWQNTPVRVAPGQEVPKDFSDWDAWIAHGETLSPDEQLKFSDGVVFQMHAGAHRKEAIDIVGLDEIKVPVIQVSDTKMMQIMALENQANRGGQPLALVESVEVICNKMMEQIADGGKNWKSYSKKFGDEAMIKSSRMYSATVKAGMPTQGVLIDFMSAKWPKNVIIVAHEAVAMLNDGLVKREMLVGFTNINVVRYFRRLVEGINATDLPPYFKNWYIEKCSERIRENESSGRIVKAAANQLRSNNDPYSYLNDETPRALNVKSELRRMINEADGVDPFDGLEGFDSEYMVTAIKEAKSEVAKNIQRAERESARDQKAEEMRADGKTEDEITEVTSAMFVEEETAEAEAEESAGEDGSGLLGAETDQDVTTSPSEGAKGEAKTSITSLVTNVSVSLDTCAVQLERLEGRVSEIDGEKFPEYFDALDSALIRVIKIKAEQVGYKELRKLVTKIETNG